MMQAVNGHDRFQGIVARAPQATSIQTSSSTPSTTSQFLPNPSKSAVPLSPVSDNKSPVKSTIEYVFLVLALFLATFLCFRRIIVRQRRRLPMSSFFGLQQESETNTRQDPRILPRTTGLLPVTLRGYPPLAGLPAAHTRRNLRRTNGADIDQSGRRFRDTDVELDYGGPLNDKDVLPAYDHFGSPPKYADVEAQRIVATPDGSLTIPHVALHSASDAETNVTDRNDAGRTLLSNEVPKLPASTSQPNVTTHSDNNIP